MPEKAYKVFMGDPRPADAMYGRLQPGQGRSLIKGTTEQAQPMPGKCMFANRSICWGRRLVQGKPVEGRLVQPTDADYSGQVEWMQWGAGGGTQIYIRLKRGCNSLDYDYQVTRLRMPKFDEDEEDSYLDFEFGENSINYDTDAVKAEFLRITHSNEDSISKSPASTGSIFREIRVFDTSKNEVKQVDNWFEATKIIKEANTYEKLNVIKQLAGKKKEIKHDDADENSLYDSLILYAKGHPDDFMAAIAEYKRKISDLFERCKSYNAFDLTKNGVVRAGQAKMEDLLANIPAKGDVMLDWMLKNCLSPEVHEAIDKLIHISAKFK